jgi:putative transposase
MDTAFCVEAVEEALGRYGTPEIFNTDQGIQISMDGKGSWRDNVFIERLWRSVKYEEVYLKAYESVSGARAGIGEYFEFYNARRPHSSLGRMTPDQFYNKPLTAPAAA